LSAAFDFDFAVDFDFDFAVDFDFDLILTLPLAARS